MEGRLRRRVRVVATRVGCALGLAVAPALGADWPQWRGPRADGSIEGRAPGAELPDQLTVVWKRAIGGGYSGPVVGGDRVFVHSRQGEDEAVSCLRLSSGEVVWREAYPAPFRQDDDALAHGRGPYATPALAGERLFTFGIDSVLIAWDAATGKRLWRRSSADEFDPAFPYFGNAASPVVWEGIVFAHLGGHERRPMERPSPGAMVALDAADGREKWRWTGDRPAAGATPVIALIGGRAQLVFKTMQAIVGLDPRTGRELWRIPYVVPMDNTIVTPLFVDGRLITSDFEWGVAAWDVAPREAGFAVRQAWKQGAVSMFLSTPVLAGGLVVGFSHLRKGQLFLLDPRSGAIRWSSDARRGEHATLVSSGSDVLVFTDDGWLIVGRVEKDALTERKRYRLGTSTGWSHPAVVAGRIVYRDGNDVAVCTLDAAAGHGP